MNTQDTMKNADNQEPVITDVPQFKPFVPTKDFWKKNENAA